MPLESGKSKKAFVHNLKAEMHAGKPMKQSLAIAYGMKRKSKKMADGGQITDNYQPEHSETHPDMADHEMDKGYVVHMGNDVVHDGAAMTEDDRMLNQHGEIEEGPQGTWMADGGDVDSGQIRRSMNNTFGTYQSTASPAESQAPNVQTAPAQRIKELENVRDNLGGSYWTPDKQAEYAKLKSQQQSKAQGGFIGSYQSYAHDEDMVGRIMKQKQKMYSEGGRVANRDQGLSKLSVMADGKPNEFDDLALRDNLEQSDTGANSGDYLGDSQEDEDRRDIVSMIMKSRAKKDRLPNPR